MLQYNISLSSPRLTGNAWNKLEEGPWVKALLAGAQHWQYLMGISLCLPRLTGNEPLSILPLSSQPEENVGRAHYKLCDRLKLEKKQRRMCRRDPGVAETLMEAISMSALECQYQFRFERWNCSLEGRYRANILKRGRERKASQLHISVYM